MTKKIIKIAGRLLISAAAILGVVYLLRDKFDEAIRIIQTEVAWNIFIPGASIFFFVLLMLSHRLQIVWGIQHIQMSFWKTFQISMVGLFFNFFLPSAVGGDLVKIYYAQKTSKKKIASATSVLADRLIGFIGLIILAIPACAVYHLQISIPFADILIWGFSILILFAFFLAFSRRFAKPFKPVSNLIPSGKIKNFFAEIYQSVHVYRKHLPELIYTVVISVFLQSLMIFMNYVISRSIGVNIPLGVFFVIIPMTTIISMAPSLGGLGVREAGSIFLLSKFIPAEHALALTLLYDFVFYGYGIAGAVFFAFMGDLMKPSTLKEMETLDGNG